MDTCTILAIVGTGAGAVTAVAAAPLVLGAAGFTAGGVAAGSYAASLMSAVAAANGGGVAAGSAVAVLQAAGAAGIPAAANAIIGTLGGAAGAALSSYYCS
nr:interferon alpha-inducible protein 27-like protein 2A [Misgurnus anguillicaudatus]